jgi:hypothetical protein
MQKLKWLVDIVTGDSTNETITIDAEDSESAAGIARVWAVMKNISYSAVGTPRADPETNRPTDFTDIIEWTPAEEEEFLRILDNSDTESDK